MVRKIKKGDIVHIKIGKSWEEIGLIHSVNKRELIDGVICTINEYYKLDLIFEGHRWCDNKYWNNEIPFNVRDHLKTKPLRGNGTYGLMPSWVHKILN